jgi:isopenicillin-N N-acyltransferase-like protein
MITEAGIIGKIGMNSAGVGICLNALKAQGCAFDKLPVHLALRAALDSTSCSTAATTLEKAAVAAAGHILIADAEGALGLECSSADIVRLEMEHGVVTHSNHFIAPHAEGVRKAFRRHVLPHPLRSLSLRRTFSLSFQLISKAFKLLSR